MTQPSGSGAPVPSNSDYNTWSYEQIVNAVLVVGMPARLDVRNEPWLTFDYNDDQDKTKLMLAGQKGFHVYLGSCFTNSSSMWQTWRNTPDAKIGEDVAHGKFNEVHIDPKGILAIGDQLKERAAWFNHSYLQFESRVNELRRDAASFKGKAAETFLAIITNVRDALHEFYWRMDSYHDPGTPIPGTASRSQGMGDRVKELGWELENFLVTIWNVWVTAAQNYRHFNAPWVLYDLMMSLCGADGKFPAGNITHYGDMTTAPPWQALEHDAKATWENYVKADLDVPAQTAMVKVSSAYLAALGTLIPLQLPPLNNISPPITDPLSSGLNGLGANLNSLGSSLSSLGSSLNGLGSGLNNIGQGLTNFGGSLSSGLNNFGGSLSSGLNNFGGSLSSGLNNFGGSLFSGLNNLGGGLPGSVYNLSSGLNNSLGQTTYGGIGSSLNGYGGTSDLQHLVTGTTPASDLIGSSSGLGTVALGGALPGAMYSPPSSQMPGLSDIPSSIFGPAGTVSSGRFVAPTSSSVLSSSAGAAGLPGAAGAAGAGGTSSTNGIPFYPPMYGGMGGMGMGQGQGQGRQERERTTWLSEDEEVWGTDPEAGPAVVGRGAAGAPEETYEEVNPPTQRRERGRW